MGHQLSTDTYLCTKEIPLGAVREYSHVYTIRYTGEYGTKQRPTRWEMIRRLERNIQSTLQRYSPETPIKIKAYWDHLLLKTMRPVDEMLTHIPGIQFFARAKVLPLAAPSETYPFIADYFRPAVEGRTFGIRARIALKKKRAFFPQWQRREAEVALGDALYSISKGVNLTRPDVFCYVEVRDEGIFLFTRKTTGTGGMPVGFTGHSLMLFSGGIDSPVAAWMAYHSGIVLDYVYYDLGGNTQLEKARQIHQLLTHRYGGAHAPALRVVDFTPIIAALRHQPDRYQNLLLKVFFYKVGESILQQIPPAIGMVTGESMGQVSTQTIHNLTLLNRFVNVPIWRPLLMMPKSEIIERARHIGTWDMAYTGKEFCALASRHVATRTHPNKITELLHQMPVEELVAEAVEGATTGVAPSSPSVDAPNDKKWVAIDLRNSPHPPVSFARSIEVRHIPFNQAWNEFLSWDPQQSYLLFCETGQQSALLARFMKEQGFQVRNIPGGAAAAADFIRTLFDVKASI